MIGHGVESNFQPAVNLLKCKGVNALIGRSRMWYMVYSVVLSIRGEGMAVCEWKGNSLEVALGHEKKMLASFMAMSVLGVEEEGTEGRGSWAL